MAFAKTFNKMTATRSFINTWLKDKTVFCANCQKVYRKARQVPCCEEPYFVDNMRRAKDFIEANKEARKEIANKYGSSESKSLRFAIRMPAELMRGLQRYFKNEYDEEFLVEKEEAHKFMREFPQFAIARRI